MTKAYTATVVLALVDQGLAGVDAPVAELLPGFRVADPEVSRRVTLRHLLCHTSGINGDFFLPEDVLWLGAAMGHVTGSPGQEPQPASSWYEMRSLGPAWSAPPPPTRPPSPGSTSTTAVPPTARGSWPRPPLPRCNTRRWRCPTPFR